MTFTTIVLFTASEISGNFVTKSGRRSSGVPTKAGSYDMAGSRTIPIAHTTSRTEEDTIPKSKANDASRLEVGVDSISK